MSDDRLKTLAFDTIDELKGQRDILVTKAVSWLMRALVANHRDDVISYIAADNSSLPALAVRETRTKLSTGIKNARRPRA